MFRIKRFSTGLRNYGNGFKDYFVKIPHPNLFTIKTLKRNTVKDSSISFRKHKIKKYKI